MWCLLYNISSQKKEGLSRTEKENNIDYSLWERGSNDRIIIIPIIVRERETEREREREREREMMMKDHLLLRTLKLFCFKHVIVIIIQRACMQ